MSASTVLAQLLKPTASDSTDDTSTENSDKIDTPASEVAEGMQCGYKSLYAGPEDKQGRFKWVDKPPSDLENPVEDAETAKFALIVRMQRVFNDPRKVLKIHSIVVQSPLLKELLGRVLQDYPGVTTTLQRLTFSGRFEPFVHRWVQLKQAIKEETNETTKEHAQLFFGVLEKEFEETIEESLDLKANNVITFALLWTLFQPGDLVYNRQDGQERATKPLQAQYGRDRQGCPVFWLTCQYVDFDGNKFGTQKVNLSISAFNGTQSITSLPVYPLDLHPQCEQLKTRLLERASRAEVLAGIYYKAYRGVGWNMGEEGEKKTFNLNERIVIDAASWNKNSKSRDSVYVTSFHRSQKPGLLFGSSKDASTSDDGGGDSDCYSDDSDDESTGDMPRDGHFPENDGKEAITRPSLTDEQKLICTPVVRGYALTTKIWINFFVNCVKEIEWNVDAFSSLVLPANQKELILGFTETQNKCKDAFDDVIAGKGKGIILLLCGPPGVGKTLTAESVAEEMRIPLYAMSAGDLGLDPRNVEQTLKKTLEMCAKWNAVFLIDEADVFLEQRSLHELERNKLVSIFLRVLEYYQGILFLTTNRVSTFDTAFASRIHISLDYPELNADSRRTVWKNFLALSAKPSTVILSDPENADDETIQGSNPAVPRLDSLTQTSTSRLMQHTITESQFDRLSLIELNGREIKNVLKTARLLASHKDSKLNFDHIKTVLEVTQHLHNSTRESDKQRGAIFA